MNITNDRSYINHSRIENGIATEQPFKVAVDRCWGKDITPLMDEIERTFKVYQYKNDNGVKYGEEELFFWTNTQYPDISDGKMAFFSLNLNRKTTPDERRAVLDRLLPILEAWDGSVVGAKTAIVTHCDGTTEEVDRWPSHARVDYHDELIDNDTLHIKALERMKEIGDRKCECGGIVGRFRHDAHGSLFQKFRTSKFYRLTDEAIACARIVA